MAALSAAFLGMMVAAGVPPVLAVLTLGEGWHNIHHHYPNSARQGFFWWEFDLTYLALRIMQVLGLTWDLKPVPVHVKRQSA